MKKIIIATISLVMAASMLAACAPKEDNKDAETTTIVTTVEETDVEAEDEADDGEMDEIPDMEFPNNKDTNAGKVAAAIGGVGEWTSMVPPYDPAMIPEMFLINPDDYKSVSINQAMMSASFAEIIVVETEDGKTADAVKALEARKEKAINQDAFYPGQDEIAENALIDSEGNFAFLIMGSSDNAACAKAAKEAIRNLK